VSEEVVEEALRQESLLKPGGSRAFATVVFADLSGFTRFAETLAPELVMDRLNEVFARLTRILLARRGTLDKYIGDCVMAFFGAPKSGEDDALRAVRAAFEMQQSFEDLKKGGARAPRSISPSRSGSTPGKRSSGTWAPRRAWNTRSSAIR
jgi:adenylate cyclase